MENRAKTGVTVPSLARKPGLGHGARRAVGLENAVGGCTPGMHDPLGNALMVEVRDLLAQMEVFEERGPSLARLERMVGIGQTHTLSRGQEIAALGSGLGTVLRRLAGRREYGRSGLVSAVGTWHLHLLAQKATTPPRSIGPTQWGDR